MINKDLMAACRTLEEYAIFIERVRQYVNINMTPAEVEAAVDRTVDECIKEGVLSEFLSKHRAEVKGMILTDYDEEKTMEMFKREFREDGYSVGYDKGRQIEMQRIALQMKTKGMSNDIIADILSITPEHLKEILSADRVHES